MFQKYNTQTRLLRFLPILLLNFLISCAGWRTNSQTNFSYDWKTFKRGSDEREKVKNFKNWSSLPEGEIDSKPYKENSESRVLGLSGVQTKYPRSDYSKLTLTLPPGIEALTAKKSFRDDLANAGLSEAIKNHLDILNYQSPEKILPIGNKQVKVQRIILTLQAFLDLLNQKLSHKEFAREITNKFEFIKTGKGNNSEALFTGYYTPIIPASRIQSSEFNFPIYKKPNRLAKNRLFLRQRFPGNPYAKLNFIDGPNYTREDIDHYNVLKDSGLEIAWLKNEMERYFLHIQGSGILKFTDGKLKGVQFAGTNGYSYQSIGKNMLEDGTLSPSQGSMQEIKKYFNEHPQDIPKYLYKNKRYIFFEFSDGTPRGSSGTPVIANRSIATDTSLYPQGGLAFISTRKPLLDASGKITSWEPFTRFVINQDTGNAIKGLGRVDLYFGIGKKAGQLAGQYMQKGSLYFLLIKKDRPLEFSKNFKVTIPVR